MTSRRERQQTIEINRPRLLLVEGVDDEIFFQRIIERRKIEGIQVIPFYGKDKFGNFLTNVLVPGMKSSDGVKAIGVTRDADKDYTRAFQSVGDSLRIAGLPVPSGPLIFAGGTFEDATIQIAAYIMPNNCSEGELETLCLEAVRQAPTMPCVDSLFECLASINHVPAKEDKARLGAFLSTEKEDPNLRIGQAIMTGVIPWDSPAFECVHQFLDLLISVE